jgi:hypothetical protein
VRERWFGATGRRVPELAVDGELDVSEALVVDDLGDAERLREAFEAGTPVVVRASSADEIKAALARPEVSCALIPSGRADLLALDLTELTYG